MIELSNYDAVIFDMDGVLVDSEPLWKIAMQEVFSSLGSNLEKTDFQKTVGLRIDEVIAYWKPIENWVPEIKEIETDIVTKMVDLIHVNKGGHEQLFFMFMTNHTVLVSLNSSHVRNLFSKGILYLVNDA